MKVLLVEPGKVPRPAEIDPSLKSMQRTVGRCIQAIYPFEEPAALICNEEGKLCGLHVHVNRTAFGETHAKEDPFERYKCVNLTNYDAIEFRMFRGTLKLNTYIATLQLVDRICDVALFLSDQEIQNLTWTDFAAGCTAPELVQYLKERRLYVNEPVQGTEEV